MAQVTAVNISERKGVRKHEEVCNLFKQEVK